VLERVTDGPGILKVENGAFDDALMDMIGRWLSPGGPIQVVLSGMIGSRQGWKEAPYARCPAGTGEIVEALARIEDTSPRIYLVPGLSTENDGMPDVMRGEETQIFGALALSGREDGLFLLPGTHSKWAEVRDGRIMSFRTFMTGEVFGALKEHTILGRLMSDGAPDQEAFAHGVREGALLSGAGALLNRLFATRTYGMFDHLAGTALADYLSGLLIGAEIAEATTNTRAAVTIIASAALAVRYGSALRMLDCESERASEDCVAAGHWRIAQAAGLVRA
jgi:2-dehydro-3-deoxygalactonokinase